MNDADVLTELRAWRDEFARSHGYDLGAMAAALRELDGMAGTRLVRGEPRRPSAVPPKGGRVAGVRVPPVPKTEPVRSEGPGTG